MTSIAEDSWPEGPRVRYVAGNDDTLDQLPERAPSASAFRQALGQPAAVLRKIATTSFLPVGYPDSVAKEYLTYQVWDTLQALTSYLRGILTVKALLEASGVGSAGASALAAAISWILRDGFGMLGSLLFSYGVAASFDHEIKTWRLFADYINDVGMTLEMVAPFFPANLFLLLTSLASACKACCGVAAGATKASITAHFARAGNAADISAKEGAQETAVTLAGMVLGVAAARALERSSHYLIASYVVFMLLTAAHVFCCRRSVAALCLTTLNRQRVTLLVDDAVARSPLVKRGMAEAAAEVSAGGGDGGGAVGGVVAGGKRGTGGSNYNPPSQPPRKSSTPVVAAAADGGGGDSGGGGGGGDDRDDGSRSMPSQAGYSVLSPEDVSSREHLWHPLWCWLSRRRLIGHLLRGWMGPNASIMAGILVGASIRDVCGGSVQRLSLLARCYSQERYMVALAAASRLGCCLCQVARKGASVAGKHALADEGRERGNATCSCACGQTAKDVKSVGGGDLPQVLVCLHVDAQPEDELKAYFHAVLLLRLLQESDCHAAMGGQMAKAMATAPVLEPQGDVGVGHKSAALGVEGDTDSNAEAITSSSIRMEAISYRMTCLIFPHFIHGLRAGGGGPLAPDAHQREALVRKKGHAWWSLDRTLLADSLCRCKWEGVAKKTA
eukprot:jgi/Mesvir1/19325/Mv10387-RA.1